MSYTRKAAGIKPFVEISQRNKEQNKLTFIYNSCRTELRNGSRRKNVSSFPINIH